jgi:replicative DNA helicase
VDIERAIISKCVNTGTVEKLVSRGIAPKHFDDEQNRAVFTTVIRHMSQYGAPPSRDAVLVAHPAYKLDVVEDTMDYLIDVFVKKVQRAEAKRSVLDLAERLDSKDADVDIDALFMEHAERVAQAVPSSRVSKLSDVSNRIELYRRMMVEGRIPGVPLGIPTIDRILLGVQKHEMVVCTAPSSVGKSTMLQHWALSSYLAGPEHKPCFITLEMEGDELLKKFDTMATNFSHFALKALELRPDEMEKWETWGERVQNAPNDIIIIDDIDTCTVERVFAETLRWKPSAMFVDYFGIMTPSRVGEKDYMGMAAMAKALKRVPRATKVPLFTAAQTNRAGFKEGVRADNVADTIEIFRSCDIMIGLEWDPDEKPDTMIVKIVKNRRGPRGHTELEWQLETMDFSERTSFEGRKTPPPDQLSTNGAVPPVTLEQFQAQTEASPPNLTGNPFM